MSNKIKEIVQSSINVKQDVLQNDTLLKTVEDCIAEIVKAFKAGNKVLFCGNGGSAADAWPQNSVAGFIPTGMLYPPRHCIATVRT